VVNTTGLLPQSDKVQQCTTEARLIEATNKLIMTDPDSTQIKEIIKGSVRSLTESIISYIQQRGEEYGAIEVDGFLSCFVEAVEAFVAQREKDSQSRSM